MTACQRRNPGGAPSWRRPSDGGFDASRYGVAPIGEEQAKGFVAGLHYSRSYPAAAQRYGMFDLTAGTPALAGVAVLSVLASKAVLTSVFLHLEPCQEAPSNWAGSCSATRCRANGLRKPGSPAP
jgi:hypothetical protein